MAAWDHDFLVDFFPVVRRGSATLEGSTELRARGRALRRASATLAGGTELRATGRALRRASATLAGSTELRATGRAVRRASAVLAGGTELRATGRLQRQTLYHILITGQSNSLGGGSAVITGPATHGYMFVGGMVPGSTGPALASLVPLQEESVTAAGQTPATTMVNWLDSRMGDLHARFLVSNVAIGGAAYSTMKKGSTPYNDSLAQITAGRARAASLGLIYKVLAIVNIHGEQDDATPIAALAYKDNLIQWQADYQTDISAITGDAALIPMFCSQQIAYPAEYRYSGNAEEGTAISLWRANLAEPDKVICVCPENFMKLVNNPHFETFSYMWLGEYMAKAIYQHCIVGTRFVPLYPTAAAIVGSTVVVDFNRPIEANFDWVVYRTDWGFRYYDTTASATVTGVAVTGDSQITVTLSGAPSGADKAIRYLTRFDISSNPGSGPVRDRDATTSLLGMPLNNYCVNFNVPLFLMALTGTLFASTTLYPYPGHTAADTVNLSTPLADAAGLVWFAAAVAGQLHICTWEPASNVFTDFGIFATVPYTDNASNLPLACWNHDRSAIYLFNWTANVSSAFQFWTYTLATNTLTDNGVQSVPMGTISDAQWDPVLGQLLFASYQDVYVCTFDPVTHASVNLVKLLRASWMAQPTTDYIYCWHCSGGGGTTGPLVRLHRNKAYFAENLCGVYDEGINTSAVPLPYYAPLKFTGRGLAVNDAGEAVFAADDTGSNRDIYYMSPTRTVTKLIAGLGKARAISFMPTGKLLVRATNNQLSVYS